MMFGYATNETDVLMPLPILLAHRLAARLAEARKTGLLPFLRPDGKTQVTVEYEDGVPWRVPVVVVSAQHAEDVTQETIRESIVEEVVKNIVPRDLLRDTRFAAYGHFGRPGFSWEHPVPLPAASAPLPERVLARAERRR